MSSEIPKRTIYNSLYRHGVDSKRRIQVPAKWRPSVPDFEFTLILWPSENRRNCIRVLPPKKMTDLLANIEAMSTTDPKTVALRRLIGSKSDQVTVDKGGRICLPESMTTEAKIEHEVVLVGLLDHFEIWRPEMYETVEVSDEVLQPEAFKLI
jgi:MraZ protein